MLTERAENGEEVYISEIHAALAEYINNARAEAEEVGDKFDMRKAPQSRWNAALSYIYNTCFKNTNKLRCKPYDYNNLKYNGCSNNNKYDDDVLLNILYIYIDLCNDYNKEISVMGYSKLCNIDYAVIDRWKDEVVTMPSTAGAKIYKKLYAEREESLSNKLVSSNQALGVLGVLNRYYGWNMGQPRETVHKIQVQDAGQIAAKYGLQIEKNHNML